MVQAGLPSAQNSSGFYGYAVGTIYPGWGNGDTQTLQTVPEVDEQAVLSDVDNPLPVQVDKGKSNSMLMMFAVLIGLLILFGRAGG